MTRKYQRVSYPKEALEEAVKTSVTMTEVLKKVGASSYTGGIFTHVKARCEAFGISTSHFLGRRSNVGRTSKKRNLPEDILVYHGDKKRRRCKELVRVLLEIGREYKCYQCGLREWRNKKISLEIEHKDGDFQNDTRDNLEFICPNCHSQTPTYCRQKHVPTGETIPKVEERARERQKKYRHPALDGYWRTRDKPSSRKVERPDKAELARLILQMPMIKIGEQFGVSDNAVRKWIRRYGLEMPKLFGRSRGSKDVRV